tara:strand:+ start:906 stop:3455 length:2550 start_codon:yes stop_codon:yes gene_type:complete
MILEEYTSKHKQVLNAIENKFNSYNVGENQSKREKAIRDMEKFISDSIRKFEKGIKSKWKEINGREMTEDEYIDLEDEIIEEIEEHLESFKPTRQEPQTPMEQLSRDVLTKMNLSHILYDGKNLNTDTRPLTSKNFSVNLISIKPNKTINVDALETDIKALKGYEAKKAQVPAHIFTNLRNLTKKLRNLQESKTQKFRVRKFDLHLDKIFGSKTRKYTDLADRVVAYEYWEKIGKQEEKMVKKISDLTDLLKNGQSEDEDILEFIKFVEGKPIHDLKYVRKFENKDIGLQSLDARAVTILKDFANMWGTGISLDRDERGKVEDYKDDEPDSEDEMDRLAREAGEGGSSGKDDSGSMMIETSVKQKEVEKFKAEVGEPVSFDPLGILAIKDDLGAFAYRYGEVEQMKAILEEGKEKIAIDKDDEDAIFDTFIDRLQEIEDYTNSQEAYLPIFAAKLPSLRIHYPDLRGDFNSTEQHIDRFLELFAKLLEKDRTTLPQKIVVDAAGAGTTKPTKDVMMRGRSVKPQFQYVKNVKGGKGSIREQFSKGKELDDDIGDKIDEITKLMADVYLETQDTPHHIGTDLPFQDNFAMRVIASQKSLDSKYADYVNAMSKLADVGEALITETEAKRMLLFTEMLTKGDSIENLDAVRRQAEVFSKTLIKIFKDISEEGDTKTPNKASRKRIQKEVASIVGSIQALSNVDSNEKIFGLDPVKEYNKLQVDRVSRIGAIRTLTNLLKSSNAESLLGDSATSTKLIDNFSQLSKSEISNKILLVHDTIRLLKNQPVYHSLKNIDSIEHMDMMITKMEREYNLDISASEITGVVNEVDSFDSISKSYGISQEHVYVIKANFR